MRVLWTVWYFAISQTSLKTLRLSSNATIPSLATTQGLHGERFHFNRASVTRDHTVCKKGPAIPEASDHFLVLVLILRATTRMRQSWRLLPCDHLGDDVVPGDLWVPDSIALPLLHRSAR